MSIIFFELSGQITKFGQKVNSKMRCMVQVEAAGPGVGPGNLQKWKG